LPISHNLKIASDLLGLLIIAIGLLVAWHFRVSVVRIVRHFFSEAGTAFNLAFFRIIFYATALPLLEVPEGPVKHYAALPRDLMIPPSGFGPIAAHFPLSPTLVHVSYVALIVASVFAAIGLFTRIASVAFVVAAAYYFTVPQLFGKVDHYHVVLWIAVLLAVSRTADVWSVDSVLRARRDARQGRSLVPPPDRAYSRPLRMTWLFLAVVYLGPGLWKYHIGGLQWASVSNMRAILYNEWYRDNWHPFIPIDRAGFLLTVGGMATIAFETSFIVLIWHRYTRAVAAAAGLFFHTVNGLTLRIWFYTNMVLFASLIDWDGISRWVFRRSGQPLILAFDGGCGWCRTTVTALARLALPGGVEFIPADIAIADPRVAGRAELPEMLSEIHLFSDSEVLTGFVAYRRLAWRIPILWPAVPLLYLGPVEALGRRVYAAVASRRTCEVAPRRRAAPTARAPKARWTLVPTLVASVILVGALGAIATDRESAWPIALYPTFAKLALPQVDDLRVVETSRGGEKRTISLRPCLSWMQADHYYEAMRAAIANSLGGRYGPLRSLLDAAGQTCHNVDAARTSTLSFYFDTISTAPQSKGRILTSRLVLRDPISA
jgi:predicted DCC family thiol-disulfide oxidoreductase YuxK